MACEWVGESSSAGAMVCDPLRGIHRRQVMKCWTCDRRTPHVVRFDGAWYGFTQWCIVCLDGWMDGERIQRPFRRGWKKKRAELVKAKWDTAMMPADFEAYVSDEMHYAACLDEASCPRCAAHFGYDKESA